MQTFVIIGLGEMGGAFAHGWLRAGRAIAPINRGDDPAAYRGPAPELVLVAVGEGELQAVLRGVPEAWRDRLVLLQNELLPPDWEQHGLAPTVASVWFEKKRAKPLHVVMPTVVAGPHASLVGEALAALEIPFELVPERALLRELVTKNLYILTANIAGLVAGGTVSELWSAHRPLAEAVAREVLAIQAWRAGVPLPEQPLFERMARAFRADPAHGCTGRSAPTRLARQLAQAETAGIDTPKLREIAAGL